MKANPFSPEQAGPLPPQLMELARPMHEALGDFIHGCSPEPATRTAATTALVLSLWQLGGRALAPPIPSMLLLRPEEDGPDPIDDFVRTMVHNEKMNEPRVQTVGPFMYAPVELAPKAMKNAILKRQKLGERIPPDDFGKQVEAQAAEEKFRAAQVTGHGCGRSRSYRKAWHPEYGLLTDADDQLILRLNDDEDRSGFRHDLLTEPGKILFPEGIGAKLFPAPKTVSISGSLPPDLWTSKHAGMLLSSGLPIFLIPHFADSPLQGDCFTRLACFADIFRSAPLPRVEASPRLPDSDWIHRYHLALRQRLAVFPVTALFPTLQAIHQLDGICRRIVGVACGPHAPEEEVLAVLHDLYHHTLRGLVISVASHTWFGAGLVPGEENDERRNKAARLLRRLRREGPVTKTGLLKNFHLKKHERDTLLEDFTGLGLICVEGDTVRATTYREFVEGLYASDEFPAVESQWESVTGRESEKHAEAG